MALTADEAVAAAAPAKRNKSESVVMFLVDMLAKRPRTPRGHQSTRGSARVQQESARLCQKEDRCHPLQRKREI